jgi:hypothetical protein
MQSYMKVSDEVEADNVASTVLNVLEQVANFRLADSNNSTNINIPDSIDGELSVSNTSRERSFDAVNGFIQVAFAYIDYVLVPQKNMSLKNSSAKKLVVAKNGLSTNGFDMSDILTVFDRCDALVLCTHGQLCFLRAQIFRKRALTTWQIFLDIHRNYSRYFNSSVESYEQFTVRVVNQCIGDLDYAKTILLDIESRVPIFESTVVKDIPVAASVPSTKASEIAPGKGGKKPAAVEAAAPLEPTESVIPSRVALTSLLRRLLVSIELNLTMVHATLSIKSAGTLTEEYLKTVSSKSDNSSNLNVAERYLEQTRVVVKRANELHDFLPTSTDKAIISALAAYRMTNSKECEILLNSIQVTSQWCDRAGEILSNSWTREVDGKSNGSALLAHNDIVSRLEDEVLNDIRRLDQPNVSESIELCALFFCNYYGKLDVKKCALWLFMYQNICARKWLLSMWRNTLNPTSEIAISLNRLHEARNHADSDSLTQQRVKTDLLLLEKSSIVWRR